MHVKYSSEPTKGDAVIELRFLTSSLIYLPCDFTEPPGSDCLFKGTPHSADPPGGNVGTAGRTRVEAPSSETGRTATPL